MPATLDEAVGFTPDTPKDDFGFQPDSEDLGFTPDAPARPPTDPFFQAAPPTTALNPRLGRVAPALNAVQPRVADQSLGITKALAPLPKLSRDTVQWLMNMPAQTAQDIAEMTPDDQGTPIAEKIMQMVPSPKAVAITTGLQHAGADLGSFFTSPLGIATLGIGALPKAAQSVVALGFAAQMAKDVPEIATQLGAEIGKPEDQRDYQKIAELTANGAAATGFAALGGAHGAGRPLAERLGAYPSDPGTPGAAGAAPPVQPPPPSPERPAAPAQPPKAPPVVPTQSIVDGLIAQMTANQIRKPEVKPSETAKTETPDWLRDRLNEQIAKGWNPKWPFVPIDLANKSFVDAIKTDPSISESERAKILSFAPGGSNEIRLAGEPAEQPIPAKEETAAPIRAPAAEPTPEPPRAAAPALSEADKADLQAQMESETGMNEATDEEVGFKPDEKLSDKEQSIKDRVTQGIDPENVRVSIAKDPAVPGWGFVQVDEDPSIENHLTSTNPETLRKHGFDIPDTKTLMELPKGQYTLPQIRELLKPKEPPAPAPVAGEGAGATKKSPFWIRPRSDGITDILDDVSELGGLRGPQESTGGEYDGWQETMTRGPAKMLIRKNARHTPDTIIHELHSLGGGNDWQRIQTPDDLYNEIAAASRERDHLRQTGGSPEAQSNLFWSAISDPKQRGGLERINAQDLKVGDTFRVRGPGISHEQLTVTHLDPDTGEVSVKDGPKLGRQDIPDGAQIWIQRGSHVDNGGKTAPMSISSTSSEVAKMDTTPPAPPVSPKLRAGERGTGDLLQGADQPFNLTGEKGTDAARIAAEKAKAEQTKKEAAEIEKKQQPDLIDDALSKAEEAVKVAKAEHRKAKQPALSAEEQAELNGKELNSGEPEDNLAEIERQAIKDREGIAAASARTQERKSREAAEALKRVQPPAEKTVTGSAKLAERFRKMADTLDNQIEHARREMSQNPTPKRNREYRGRRHDADNMERTQKALRAMAEAHESNSVPPELVSIRTKDDVASLVRKGLLGGGYYDVIPDPEYSDKSPKAKAMQRLIERETPEQVKQRVEREKAQKINQLEESVRFSNIPGFFPTPKPLAEELVRRADIRPGQSVLEPSAGKGDLADVVREQHPDANITTVERMNTLRQILEAKGYDVAPTEDFLQHEGQYDRIVMNPPFEKGQDIEHVRKAYEMLKPGGKLSAIMSEGSFSRGDKKATEFRDWLDERGGTSEKVESGAFQGKEAFRQTGVASRIVEIERPIEKGHPSIGGGIKAALEKNQGEAGMVRIPSKEEVLATWDRMFGGDARKRLKDQWIGTLGTIAGKTLPRITRGAREAGEAGAHYISSKISAGPLGRIFAHNVIGSDGIDPIHFGAALSEDNLRSVKAANLQRARDAVTPEEATRYRSIAEQTYTFIGKRKPFKTEDEYQAFLARPDVQTAIQKHIEQWDRVIEPMYKDAMMYEPDAVLHERGIQTGARVNLFPIREDDVMSPGAVWGSSQGNLLNTFRRKSPFGVQAEGIGSDYVANYNEIMSNTFSRQVEIANKNKFDDSLVKHGLAVIDRPGQKATVGGEETVAFPLERKTVVVEGQGAFPQNKMLYVKRSLAREYRNAANVDDNPYHDFITTRILNTLNKAALAGLTDATVHITNLTTGLAQLPVSKLHPWADAFLSAAGRLDIPVALTRVAAKGAPEAARTALQSSKLLKKVTPDVMINAIENAFWKNQKQMAKMADIGAMKSQEPATGLPIFRHMSSVIHWYDRTVRMVLDDAFQDLAERGVVENTPTNRREFDNQVGQYNKRAQGALVRLSRDLGTGPFVTAGRAFNILGVRAATLNPGVTATSAANAAMLRMNMLAKWGGTLGVVALSNYLITGHVFGRPGTPIGSIDEGDNDAQGRMKNFSVINLTGQGRALRVVGARGAIEAKRKGLNNATALDAAGRDIVNSWAAPFMGPSAKFASVATTGYQPAVDVPRASKVVPPGESQKLENLKQALLDMNPIASGLSKANEPGKNLSELIKTQLPRFTMQTTQPEDMIANYPEIVRHAQANAFMEDVMRRARYMSPEVKGQYLEEALMKLDPEDRPHALMTLKFRRVIQ